MKVEPKAHRFQAYLLPQACRYVHVKCDCGFVPNVDADGARFDELKNVFEHHVREHKSQEWLIPLRGRDWLCIKTTVKLVSITDNYWIFRCDQARPANLLAKLRTMTYREDGIESRARREDTVRRAVALKENYEFLCYEFEKRRDAAAARER
jgi:hypothetical protein